MFSQTHQTVLGFSVSIITCIGQGRIEKESKMGRIGIVCSVNIAIRRDRCKFGYTDG